MIQREGIKLGLKKCRTRKPLFEKKGEEEKKLPEYSFTHVEKNRAEKNFGKVSFGSAAEKFPLLENFLFWRKILGRGW